MNTRVAIVTGAAGGIGSGIVDHLLADGYAVLGVDLRIDDPDRDHLRTWCGDLTDTDSAAGIVDAALSAFGSLDVVVNCAGLLKDARIERMDREDFAAVVQVNLIGAIRLTGAALPHLRRSGTGRVISIASRALLGSFGSSNYATAKGGLVGLTRSLALAEGPRGVTANTIGPGFIETPMTRHLADRTAEAIPVRRAGTPADVARAVSFLAAPDAGYLTGQNLMICGGRSLQP